MGIIDKLSSIDTSTVSVNNEYMELQLCKEDYEYLKNIENIYSKAYDFQSKYIDDCLNFIIENSTDAEKELYDTKDGISKYMDGVPAHMLEHYYISRLLRVCNNSFIYNVDKYFIKKYNIGFDNGLPYRTHIIEIPNDKMTVKDVLEYIRINYNFIPPSQGLTTK